MTSAKAILTGAALIAASVLFVNTLHSAEAQRYAVGPFQLMQNGNPSANSSVFRLDATTGEVSYCYVLQNNGATELQCTKAVK